MKIRSITLSFAFLFALLPLAASARLPKLPLSQAEESRVEALIGSMSLSEKIGQLNQPGWGSEEGFKAAEEGKVGSFLNITGADKVNQAQRRVMEKSPKKIPLIFGLDVIHGYVTSFPIPLAEASSWDLGLAQRCAAAAGVEARAGGLRWTFAPMVDIARDPRWGRILEGAGEDPLLGAAFAAARVRGFQKDRNLAACVKHFVGYGAAEAGRDYNAVDIPERKLWEVYYPPFQAGLMAGAATLMSSFNTLNGLPLAADIPGLRGLLKDDWGFDGFIVSDWNSVGELEKHGVAKDQADAARQGMLAGVDMDMAGRNYLKTLEAEVAAGRVPEKLVDDALRRVLRVKAWLGLFEEPYVDEALAPKVTLSREHRALALEAAQKACVLLKNEGVLPISKSARRIALIGPLADNQEDSLGAWRAKTEAKDVVTLLAGLKARMAKGTEVLYARGCGVTQTSRDGFEEALKAAGEADVVVLAMGEHRDMSGEPYARTELGLPGVQRELAQEITKLGKPTVLVLFNGRPLTLEWEAENIPAILEAWFLGSESGHAIADILLGNFNPEGRLTATFPRVVGQIPIYHSVLPTARPGSDKDKWTSNYLDSPNTARYVFGHGLSYTKFEYSGLELPRQLKALDSVLIRAKVKNTGARVGVETVQLYLRDPVASVSRPVKELRGFQKISLKPGASKTVSFLLRPADLGLYDRKLEFGLEPGRFEVWVGPDSSSGLKGEFNVQGDREFYALPGERPMLALEQATQASQPPKASPPMLRQENKPALTAPGREAVETGVETGPVVP